MGDHFNCLINTGKWTTEKKDEHMTKTYFLITFFVSKQYWNQKGKKTCIEK